MDTELGDEEAGGCVPCQSTGMLFVPWRWAHATAAHEGLHSVWRTQAGAGEWCEKEAVSLLPSATLIPRAPALSCGEKR